MDTFALVADAPEYVVPSLRDWVLATLCIPAAKALRKWGWRADFNAGELAGAVGNHDAGFLRAVLPDLEAKASLDLVRCCLGRGAWQCLTVVLEATPSARRPGPDDSLPDRTT